MDRVLRLLGLVLLLCYLAMPAFADNVPPPAPVTANYVAVIPLNNTPVAEMMFMVSPSRAGEKGLHDFLPSGITDIRSLSDNRLLVTSTSADALAKVRELIRLLDQPRKLVDVDVYLLSMTPAAQETLMAPANNQADVLAPVLKEMIRKGDVALRKHVRDRVVNGEAGFIDFGLDSSLLRGIVVNDLTVHPDGSITVDLQAIQPPSTEQAQAVTGLVKPSTEAQGIVRVGAGKTLWLSEDFGFAGMPPDGARTKTLLLVIPKIHTSPSKPDK